MQKTESDSDGEMDHYDEEYANRHVNEIYDDTVIPEAYPTASDDIVRAVDTSANQVMKAVVVEMFTTLTIAENERNGALARLAQAQALAQVQEEALAKKTRKEEARAEASRLERIRRANLPTFEESTAKVIAAVRKLMAKESTLDDAMLEANAAMNDAIDVQQHDVYFKD